MSKSNTKTFISALHKNATTKLGFSAKIKINSDICAYRALYRATIVGFINGGGESFDDFCVERLSRSYLLSRFRPICARALDRSKPNECSHARAACKVFDA